MSSGVVSKDIPKLQETTFNAKFSHLMVPSATERNISIVNCPLPPIPTNSTQDVVVPRSDSKNSLDSEDDNYLIPHCNIKLQTLNDMDEVYVKPTFHTNGYCNSVNRTERTLEDIDNYIPMKSY